VTKPNIKKRAPIMIIERVVPEEPDAEERGVDFSIYLRNYIRMQNENV
jgi:hypothetical protein